ncbi:hypothetical protein LPY66_11345 [Dehalobacter sp. DCM]|uniref:hypothetical protein n=1 Tax=Dehalobacter sp. DCM TaxID=2907827 RepID=UPI003081F1CF|nr:hypothetical protein LPY66_11345 [Dehalobacter sp. DCM]
MGNVIIKEKYGSTLITTDLIDSASPAVIASVPVKLGEYQVQAGEMIAIGQGSYGSQESAVGRIYMKIYDDTATAVAEPGLVRLSVWSPQNRPLMVLGEWRTEALESGATDRSLRIPLPESNVRITEDKKLVLEFISDADDALDRADCAIALDVTRYTVQ